MVDIITNILFEILSLFRSNYLAAYHIRQMAQLIRKSHVTLLPHLKKLEKDKILIPKVVGKNKTFSLNLDNIITREYLIITEKFAAIQYLREFFIIKKITADILKLSLPGSIILFGSYAKRAHTKESDIDILYLGNLPENDAKHIKKIGDLYGKRISIKKAKNFGKALRIKDPLAVEVIKNHIILQNTESFVDSVLRYYNDVLQ